MPISDVEKSIIDAIRARWTTQDIEQCCALFQKTGAATSPFGQYKGLEDFRGFILSITLSSTTMALAGKRPISREDVPPISKFDFSYSDLKQGGFADVIVDDCKFDGIEYEGNWGRGFHRCSFSKAKLSRAFLSGQFVECDFSGVNFSFSKASAPDSFLRCNFTKTNFRSANWTRVRFENCTFDGAKFDRASVSGSRFIGTAPSEEQLKDTLVAKVVYEDVPER